MFKIDLHTHTRYSPDSESKLKSILKISRKRGIDALAITDHDSFSAYKYISSISKSYGINIIPGVEVTLPYGKYGLHLVCLFIDKIPTYDVYKIFDEVKDMGGIITLPHPFRIGTGLYYHLKNKNIDKKTSDFILDNVNYIECLNLQSNDNELKPTFDCMNNLDIPIIGVSDSHNDYEIGLIYNEFEDLESLRNGNPPIQIVTYAKTKSAKNINEIEFCLNNRKKTLSYQVINNETALKFSQLTFIKKLVFLKKIYKIINKLYLNFKNKKRIDKFIINSRKIILRKNSQGMLQFSHKK